MHSYLDMLDTVLNLGEDRMDRTGVGTRSRFSMTSAYNLANGFPILTTKRIPFTHIATETCWYLKGGTNTDYLHDHGVTIWDEWADENGDLGPVYGAQWRDWIGQDGEHHDQLATLINDLKYNPTSRRHILTAWNVGDLHKMALPPCHMMAQFYVENDGTLNCQLYQRSADLFLGVPWNIASYALLTHVICHHTGHNPGTLFHVIGDAHIYHNHLNQVQEQLNRRPGDLPHLLLANPPASDADPSEWEPHNFELTGYNPQPSIKAPVAV